MGWNGEPIHAALFVERDAGLIHLLDSSILVDWFAICGN